MPKKNQTHEPKDAIRKKLENDVDEFLRKGGTIEQIASGVSGVNITAPKDKSIKLGKPK